MPIRELLLQMQGGNSILGLLGGGEVVQQFVLAEVCWYFRQWFDLIVVGLGVSYVLVRGMSIRLLMILNSSVNWP